MRFEDNDKSYFEENIFKKEKNEKSLTSPLHVACCYNYIEIIKLPIQFGVNLNKE